jgi:hypothetical protein
MRPPTFCDVGHDAETIHVRQNARERDELAITRIVRRFRCDDPTGEQMGDGRHGLDDGCFASRINLKVRLMRRAGFVATCIKSALSIMFLQMTVVEIIEEIKRLPRAEQNRIIDFARKAGEARQLTPEELGELTKKMVEAKDPAEADRWQAEIVGGFYGRTANA